MTTIHISTYIDFDPARGHRFRIEWADQEAVGEWGTEAEALKKRDDVLTSIKAALTNMNIDASCIHVDHKARRQGHGDAGSDRTG